jgi:hypothetical protein
MPTEAPRLIIDGKGTEREIFRASFPDKKERPWSPTEADKILMQTRELVDAFDVGQTEATFIAHADYPDLPIVISLMTDTHYGAIHANTELLNEHLKIVGETPNFYMVHNGDHTDNFNATGKWASAMSENPLPQQVASRAWAAKLREIDKVGKIAALGFGNHDNFGAVAGQDYHETFLGDFQAPIFNQGGLLHIQHGGQEYHLAMTHMYWGNSKLNPTNACKRFLEFEYPIADIVFLGHTHQSEGLHFEKGGKDRVAVIGGTYKDSDSFARTHGIGGRAGTPGWCVALWPHERGMMLFNDMKKAQEWMYTAISSRR